MSIRLTQTIFLAGAHIPVDGATLNLTPALEADLVSQGKAVWVSRPATSNEHGQQAARYIDAAPAAFTSRTLIAADNGATLICATAQTATVNTGLPTGFGCAFKGAVSFAGTATVTDVRTTGATNPWCSLVQTGADTYDAVGSKA